jgi:hypothetical protein
MFPPPCTLTFQGTRLFARTLLIAACSGFAFAADPPLVPDPLGLGERLALIDCLQETYHVTPPIGESLDQLRARYVTAWNQAQAQTPEHQDADSQQVRVERLRRLISTRFHQEADPTLDENGLLAELHRLEGIQQDQDQLRLAALAASPDAGGKGTGSAPARAPAAVPFTAPAARPPTAPGLPALPAKVALTLDLHLETTMEGVSECLYKRGNDHSILMVHIGGDWNGAFRGAPEHIWATYRNAKEIHRAVAILGHGNGTGIGGLSIMDHIKKYQAFYESMGGQEPSERIACLLFASCSEGSSEQIGEMRNGLGYYPTWRIAAGARVTMNLAVFLGALRGIMDQPSSTPFRGVYRYGTNTEFSGAVGEVGVDGERGNPVNFWVDGSGAVIPGR